MEGLSDTIEQVMAILPGGSSTGGDGLSSNWQLSVLQQSFDSSVLSGEISAREWYDLVWERYPNFRGYANDIYNAYLAGTRVTASASAPVASGTAGGGMSSASSILQSSDAAFIAAAVAVLGIALLVMRGR